MRGTFANVRLKNLLVPGVEGGVTRHLPDGEQMSIFDAVDEVPGGGRAAAGHLAGKEYGSGSSPRLGGEGDEPARA